MFSHPNDVIEHVDVIESGLGSVIDYADERPIEIGIFGPDGMRSMALVLSSDRLPPKFVARIARWALRLGAGDFRRAIRREAAASRSSTPSPEAGYRRLMAGQ